MAVRGILRDQNRQEEYDLISESVHAEENSTADYIPVIPVISDDTTSEPAEEETEPEILTQYASLYEQNPDLFGWICIEDTVLDYPVMHTPDDPEKYLRLSFEGETSTAGTPFLDAKCGIDSDNYIIYGHNMKNGTMFSDVTQYRNEDYFTEHPIIEFETAQGLKLYTVFAVVYVKNNDGWYDFHTAADETDYNNKIAEIKRRALYDTGITPEYGQQLLTLSTCYGATKSDRIIVIGVESNP